MTGDHQATIKAAGVMSADGAREGLPVDVAVTVTGRKSLIIVAAVWIALAGLLGLVVWGGLAAARGYHGAGCPDLAPAPCNATGSCVVQEAGAWR